jgi:hypothetical protein
LIVEIGLMVEAALPLIRFRVRVCQESRDGEDGYSAEEFFVIVTWPLEGFHCSNPSVTGSQEAPMTHKVGRRLEKCGHFALCMLLDALRASSIDHSSSSASSALEPYILEFLEATAVGRERAAIRARTWRKLIRMAIHLHPYVEAFCDDQVEFLCNASTEALCVPSDAPVGTVTCSSLEIGKCTTLRLISLRVGNDDFATTEETRV